MNVRLRRRILNLGTALFALAALASVVAGFSLPVRVEPPAVEPLAGAPDAAGAPTSKPSDRREHASALSLSDLKRLAARDLRRPLFDEPAERDPGNEKAPAPPAPLPLELIGIADEPGHSMAIFRTPTGGIKVCAEGQSVEHGGAAVKVTAIERGGITVLYQGKARELTLPPQP